MAATSKASAAGSTACRPWAPPPPLHTLLATAGIALAALVVSSTATAAEVAGVKLEDTVNVGGTELQLNGLGVRGRAVFKVYAIGFYLGRKESTAEAVLAAPGPRRFTIVMLREILGEDLGMAFVSRIHDNHGKAERARFAGQMAKFGAMFASVDSLKEGDTLTGDWIPGKGTTIELNGKPIGEPLPDLAFYNALLKIWIGDRPADTSLKPLLLGGKADGAS